MFLVLWASGCKSVSYDAVLLVSFSFRTPAEEQTVTTYINAIRRLEVGAGADVAAAALAVAAPASAPVFSAARSERARDAARAATRPGKDANMI